MRQAIRRNIIDKYGVEEKPIYTLLLDMNSIMKASMVDKRVGCDGKVYGMVYQTLHAIRNQLVKKSFNFVYAMYDGNNSGQLRYEIYKDYKSNRDKNFKDSKSDYDKAIDAYCRKVIEYSKGHRVERKLGGETDDEQFERQRSIIMDICEELYIRQVMCDDVEGDDLIAHYVNNKKPNEKVVIVSGDRDLTQLIREDVCVYVTQLKKYITPSNHKAELGFPHYNVLVKKIFCGDASDAIKGIKGLGETTFFKLFPEAMEREVSVAEIVEKARSMCDERVKAKKKPLKVLENIVGSVTDGCQGKDIYEVNEKIIDLSKPLLTEEAVAMYDALSYAPLDSEGRDYGNVFNIIRQNNMSELMDTNHFTSFFAPFQYLRDMELKYHGEHAKS